MYSEINDRHQYSISPAHIRLFFVINIFFMQLSLRCCRSTPRGHTRIQSVCDKTEMRGDCRHNAIDDLDSRNETCNFKCVLLSRLIT